MSAGLKQQQPENVTSHLSLQKSTTIFHSWTDLFLIRARDNGWKSEPGFKSKTLIIFSDFSFHIFPFHRIFKSLWNMIQPALGKKQQSGLHCIKDNLKQCFPNVTSSNSYNTVIYGSPFKNTCYWLVKIPLDVQDLSH